jgi:hypothetical protein
MHPVGFYSKEPVQDWKGMELPVGVPESYPAGAVEYRADSEGKWYEGI